MAAIAGKIAVVTGPTASGKTGLAVALAQHFDGEVVSADSMQIYRGMDIGTAKPTEREKQGIRHHMLDLLEPGESYSAARYAAEAGDCVEDILARDKLPIVCGGTGLYIDALIAGNRFMPSGDGKLRRELEADYDRVGGNETLRRLSAIDPESGAKLSPNDKKRIVRALEVHALTGKTISTFNAESKLVLPRFWAVMVGLEPAPREYLYRRIDDRVDQMMADGLLDEVRRLRDAGRLAGTAAQAIGYKELLGYIGGECGLEEAVSLLKQKTRNYAKRQLTWFRRDGRIGWLRVAENTQKDELLARSTNYLVEAGIR